MPIISAKVYLSLVCKLQMCGKPERETNFYSEIDLCLFVEDIQHPAISRDFLLQYMQQNRCTSYFFFFSMQSTCGPHGTSAVDVLKLYACEKLSLNRPRI